MIVGIGVDVVEIARIAAVVQRHGDRARRRFFTAAELAECDARMDPGECFATRFAAKEAALKALGIGMGPGICWTDVEVERLDSGPPKLRYAGKARELATALNVERSWVSLSHEHGLACAVVVLERGASEQ